MDKYENLKNLTVLYVEDDEDIQRQISIVLEDYVGRLILAKNGQEALGIFDTHNIDVVITDILMPKLNGIELAKIIRNGKTNPHCPVIITTVHTETPYLLDAINLKVDAYLIKPTDIDELLNAIQKAMLPKLQALELESKNLLINAVDTFIGGKKIEIINFLLENCDEDHVYYGSYEDIISHLNVSKPTIVKTFKQLIEVGLLIKIKNKVYKIHPDMAIKQN